MKKSVAFAFTLSVLLSCTRDTEEDFPKKKIPDIKFVSGDYAKSDAPGTNGEDAKGSIDLTGRETQETVTQPETHVADLQQKEQGLNCPPESDFINMDRGVKLNGVIVTAPVFSASAKLDGFFVQDSAGGPYSGIKVVLEKGSAPVLAVGDIVDLVGDLKEYYCVTELGVTSVTVKSHGSPPSPELLAPEDIAADNPEAELWEGVLVRIENVTVEDVDSHGMTADGVRIENKIFTQLAAPKPGCKYLSVTGVLDFAFKKYRLLPRTADDLVLDESVECQAPRPADTIKSIQEAEASTTCTGEPFVNVGPVSLSGVVVVSPRFEASKGKLHGFFVSNGVGGPNSGLLVVTDFNSNVLYQIGDVLNLSGTWTEFYCMSEVKAETHEKTGSFSNEIPVFDITAADLSGDGAEAYEAVLVRLTDVEVIEGMNKYGEFIVTGNVMISNKFLPDLTVEVGDKFGSITGPVMFSFGNYKIMPRFPEDLVAK